MASRELPRLEVPEWAQLPMPGFGPGAMGPYVVGMRRLEAEVSKLKGPMTTAARVANGVLDWVPIIGDIKAGIEAVVGYNMLGEKLSAGERVLSALTILPLGDFLRLGKYADEAAELGKHLDEGEDVVRSADEFADAARHGDEALGGGEQVVRHGDEAAAAAAHRPRLNETNHKLSGETAGTGGIQEISSRRNPDGSLQVTIKGELKDPIPRADAPNFNTQGLPTGKDVGLPDYEIAHLWGPGFGDEARDGLMYAPREVNQVFQNHAVESRLRELQELAAREGATIKVTASAESHALTTGHETLSHASYRFEVQRPGETASTTIAEVDIWVPAPGAAGKVTVEVTGGSAGVFSPM